MFTLLLVLTFSSGQSEAYVIDSGMSQEDCQLDIAESPLALRFNLSCWQEEGGL